MERNELGQFAMGHKETAEEKIIRSRARSEAWRKSPDYVGDIKDECPKVFNCWRSIKFTSKGKAVGCSDKWPNFLAFYNDVRPTYKKGLVLRRKDIMFPWGPDNFMWVTNKEAGAAKTIVTLTYNGEELSIIQWAEKLGMSYGTIKLRYYRHKDDWTVEEILFGKKKKRNSKDAKDITDSGVNIRSKASKMISSYKHGDYVNGTTKCDITIEWMIDNILTKPCSYCGDTRRVGCDRIDNQKGHTMDNVVPCCIECNTARNKYFTYEEMRILGRTIAEIKKARNNKK